LVVCTNKRAKGSSGIYEDNDFLSIKDKGADKACSGGPRFYFFMNKNKEFFVIRIYAIKKIV
jgi:hypothetical protein